jgi:hypothetical protein
VDADTWVITHSPKDLPVLSEEQISTGSQGAGVVQDPGSADLPTSLEQQYFPGKDRVKPSTVAEHATFQRSLSPAAIKVHTYLLNYTFAPPDGAHHILDIAAAVYLSREEVRQALAELKDLGMANVTGKDGWWWATKVEQGQGQEQEQNAQAPSAPSSSTAIIRDAPSFKDTPPSPTLAPSSTSPLHLDTLNLDDFFSYSNPSGARWTRLDKRLIDAAVLIAAEEEYEDVGDSLVVHRVLRRGEIRQWAEESEEVRKALRAFREREAKRWADQSAEVREALRVFREDEKNKAGKAGEESVGREDEDSRAQRNVEIPALPGSSGGVRDRRDEKEGKGKDERDAYQEKLDRVIAGDMKEDELRRFADRDDERYI